MRFACVVLRLLPTLLLVLCAACQPSQRQEPVAEAEACPDLQMWETFKSTLMTPDGRVVDPGSDDSRTVSEAQAYALFFALVADDRDAFEQLLRWTENNLAQGDLTAHLPAWLWGRSASGNWGVLDPNPASDADLWIAYSLLEAGHLWQQQRYAALGELLAERILREEVRELPGLGLSLLPAPSGFQLDESRWRLNPSYVPPQLLRRLSHLYPASAWAELLDGSWALLEGSSKPGYAPDWIEYSAEAGLQTDEQSQGVGSYDAIRVYLWVGMLHPQQQRVSFLDQLGAMPASVAARGVPPEKFMPDGAQGVAPAGFSAALLPFFSSRNEAALLRTQQLRVAALADWRTSYYQQALRLFGQGWMEGHFRFGPDGALLPAWGNAGC